VHELAIVNGILEAVTERSEGARILRIVLEIGELTAILPDALQFCFDIAAHGTAAEGAKLDIERTEGLAKCRACRREVPVHLPHGLCPCGSTSLDLIRGDELRIREMEVA